MKCFNEPNSEYERWEAKQELKFINSPARGLDEYERAIELLKIIKKC